jgi:hypothetical protein
MGTSCPSFEFFEALANKAEQAEGLRVCDAMFALAVGESMVTVEFESPGVAVVARGGNPNDMDFVLTGSSDAWKSLFLSIARSGGADAPARIESLLESGDGIALESDDNDAREQFDRCATSLQAFFDLARDLEFD